jgi:hypothetical protein
MNNKIQKTCLFLKIISKNEHKQIKYNKVNPLTYVYLFSILPIAFIMGGIENAYDYFQHIRKDDIFNY